MLLPSFLPLSLSPSFLSFHITHSFTNYSRCLAWNDGGCRCVDSYYNNSHVHWNYFFFLRNQECVEGGVSNNCICVNSCAIESLGCNFWEQAVSCVKSPVENIGVCHEATSCK